MLTAWTLVKHLSQKALRDRCATVARQAREMVWAAWRLSEDRRDAHDAHFLQGLWRLEQVLATPRAELADHLCGCLACLQDIEHQNEDGVGDDADNDVGE